MLVRTDPLAMHARELVTAKTRVAYCNSYLVHKLHQRYMPPGGIYYYYYYLSLLFIAFYIALFSALEHISM